MWTAPALTAGDIRRYGPPLYGWLDGGDVAFEADDEYCRHMERRNLRPTTIRGLRQLLARLHLYLGQPASTAATADLEAFLDERTFDSVRDEHDVLVGGTIATHRGEVVKHTGDGLMAALRRAEDAVAAALIQRLISRRNEGSEVALGVRVGISAGDVLERAGD
jgi:class 3 adenylate cyclase